MTLFPKRRQQSDFSAELESHITIEAERLREEGLSATEAQAAARRRFGNVLQAQEQFYDSQRVLWFHDAVNDILYAVRQIRKSPVFALTVILTLALGMGAAATIFGITDAALIKPLPFPRAQELVSFYERWQGDLDSPSPADYLDFRNEAKSFKALAAFRSNPSNLGGQNRPERVRGVIVTPNFFSVLNVKPELGRTLDPLIDKPGGGARSVVLSDSLWKRRYGGASNVLAQTISVDGAPATVAGVMPPGFTYPDDAAIWMEARFQVPEHPLHPLVDPSALRTSHYFDIIGRLKPNVDIHRAQAEVEVIARRLAQQHKDEEEGDGPVLITLRDDLVGNTRPAIFILLVAVVILFVTACANVANLVLARGTTRQKEIAIRGSLGAGRFRLIRQLLVESLLLSLAGALLGLAVSTYGLRGLEPLLPPDVLPAGGLHVDFGLILFSGVAAILSTVLFGLLPAIRAAKVGLNSALKEGGGTSGEGKSANGTRKILLVTQVALATILLIGAGLLIHSLNRLLSAPQGFSPDHVLSLQLSLPPAQYKTPESRNRFATGVLQKIASLAGVHSVGITSRLPLNPGASQRGIQIKGRPAMQAGDISPSYLTISPDYFRTLRVPVVEGRRFTDRDTSNASGVLMINVAMARHFWPNQDAIGQYVKTDRNDWSQIVGVVGDVAQQGLDKAPRPTMYMPYAQDPWPALAVVIRTDIDPKSISAAAISTVHEVDKDEPVYDVRTMDEVIASSVRMRHFRTVLLSLFAVLALALATIGTYGVMACTVAQRSHEIGIRLALGARPAGIRTMIIGEGFRLAGCGILAGTLLALGLTRFLAGILYGIKSTDPISFSAPLVLLLAAFLASYFPAHQAMRMDPANIFRSR